MVTLHLLKPELVPTLCSFTNPAIRWEPCGLLEVVEPFICTWTMNGQQSGRRIDAGYVCDGPSVPQAFRDVVDWWKLLPAALGHDWDYEAHGGDRLIKVINRMVPLVDWVSNQPARRTREECDHIFYGFARQCVGEKQARIAFTAVRLFGSAAWADEE